MPNEWIIGRGWDQNLWPSKDMPHHAELSAETSDHPVWLVRVDDGERVAGSVDGADPAERDYPVERGYAEAYLLLARSAVEIDG